MSMRDELAKLIEKKRQSLEDADAKLDKYYLAKKQHFDSIRPILDELREATDPDKTAIEIVDKDQEIYLFVRCDYISDEGECTASLIHEVHVNEGVDGEWIWDTDPSIGQFSQPEELFDILVNELAEVIAKGEHELAKGKANADR